MQLTLSEDMWRGDGTGLAKEVMGYQVLGMPASTSAFLRHHHHEGWQLLVSTSEEPIAEKGYFETPDAAIAWLNANLTATR